MSPMPLTIFPASCSDPAAALALSQKQYSIIELRRHADASVCVPFHLCNLKRIRMPGADIRVAFAKCPKFGDELFERMIAAISLYRPGPMDYIPDYEKGLKDPTSITYDTPQLEPILKNTYGKL